MSYKDFYDKKLHALIKNRGLSISGSDRKLQRSLIELDKKYGLGFQNILYDDGLEHNSLLVLKYIAAENGIIVSKDDKKSDIIYKIRESKNIGDKVIKKSREIRKSRESDVSTIILDEEEDKDTVDYNSESDKSESESDKSDSTIYYSTDDHLQVMIKNRQNFEKNPREHLTYAMQEIFA